MIVKSKHFNRKYNSLGQARNAAIAIAQIPGEGKVTVTEGWSTYFTVEAKPDVVHSVTRSLHFPTSVQAGNTYNHIISEAAFPITTERRTVHQGDPLCGRSPYRLRALPREAEPSCAGCAAIAEGLAERDAAE